MKRFFFLLLLLSTTVYGQNYLDNSAYICGVGVGRTQEQADSLAMLNFSRNVKFEVGKTVTHNVKEDSDGVSSIYENNTHLTTRIIANGTKTYVEKSRKGYKIYRYICKEEYRRHVYSQLQKYLDAIEDYSKETKSQDLNLLLGNYYLAYQTLDDPIMDAIDGYDNISMKMYLKEEAKKVYASIPRLSAYDRGNPNRISLNGGDPLYAFEFSNDLGETWKEPKAFSPYLFGGIESNSMCGDRDLVHSYRSCYVTSSKFILCRVCYMILVNNTTMKIEVPDEWYFLKSKIRLFI